MFDSARLKLHRADKHIADLQTIIRTLPQRYTSTIEIDHNAGAQSVVYELPNADGIAKEMALITGDAIHNIKTALDYAWIGAVTKIPAFAVTSTTKFPICPAAKDVESALRKVNIHVACPVLFKWVMTVAKPHRGGNDFVFYLHKLDIADKHRLLLPLANNFSIMGLTVEDDTGKPVTGDTAPAYGWGPIHADFFLKNKIKDKGKPTPTIVFENGLPAEGFEVLDTLLVFSKLVLDLVQRLERLHIP